MSDSENAGKPEPEEASLDASFEENFQAELSEEGTGDGSGVRKLSSAPPGSPMDEKDKAGVNLAKIVLSFIGGFLVLSMILLVFYEQKYDSVDVESLRTLMESEGATAEEVSKLAQSLTDLQVALKEERDSYREHWADFNQLALLNLLLPVLTAILGYVFGSRQGASDEASSDESLE